MVISQNIVIVNFLFILISVMDNGFSDFHTLLPGSPLIRANKTKITYGLILARDADLIKFVNDCVSRNGCRINTTDPIK